MNETARSHERDLCFPPFREKREKGGATASQSFAKGTKRVGQPMRQQVGEPAPALQGLEVRE